MGRWLLVALFFLALVAAFTYPLVLEPGALLLVGLGDYPTETSMVTWNARQAFRNPLGVFQVPFYYPYSSGAAYQQSAFFTGLLAAPLLALGAPPLMAVNLLLIAELVASGVLMYALAYAITGRVVASLLAGVVFTFYPNRMDHIGQFTYQQAFLFPLIVGAASRFLLEGRWRHLALAAAAMWAQLLSSLYNGYALCLLLLGLAATFLLLRPYRLSWSLVGRSAVGGLALGLALLPFALPYLAVNRELGFERTLAEGEEFGMHLLSFLDPGEFSWLYRDRLLSHRRSEGGMFPGFVALALAGVATVVALRAPAAPGLPPWARRVRWAAAAVAAWAIGTIGLALAFGKVRLAAFGVSLLRVRNLTTELNVLPVLILTWAFTEGRRGRRGPLDAREWTLVALALAVLAYLLCLTPTLRFDGHSWGSTLFRWVYEYVPGGQAFRAPGRWSLVFALPVALLAALGLSALTSWLGRPWHAIVPAVLVALTLVEYAITPIRWERMPARPAVYDWLARQPGDFAVLQLPLAERSSDAWAMLWALDHGKRVVNGHGGFAVATWNELVKAAVRRDPERLSTAIQSIYPLRYVILHPELLGPKWAGAFPLIQQGRVPGLYRVGAFGDQEVYGISPTPQRGREIHRHFASDVARRRPVAEYTLRLIGDDPEIVRRVEVRFNGRLLATHTGPVTARLALAAPVRRADRNDLSFRHVYTLTPAVAAGDLYRIGTTGARSPVDIEVRSAAYPYGNDASIRVNGHELVTDRFRGYWIAALAPEDGRVLSVDYYDTHQSTDASRRLVARVTGLRRGTIVVLAVLDEAGWQLTEEAVQALRAVGASADLRAQQWLSHVVVGVQGARAGQAVEAWGPGPVGAVVGRVRAVELSIEAFELLPGGPS